MGFNKPANTDVAGTLKAAIDKINALPTAPDSSCTPVTLPIFEAENLMALTNC